MYHSVKKVLDDALGESVILEIPKDSSLGHFATPIAFSIAKRTATAPQKIAERIAQKLESRAEFKRVSALKGFINLTLSDSFISRVATTALNNSDDFAKATHSGRILLEFVSANPTGPLHIGHARGAIFGDILARIGAHLGYTITREYYINDAGSQIDMLGDSVILAAKSALGLPVEYPEIFYRGDYINDLAKIALEHFGEEFFKNATNSTESLNNFCVKEMMSVIVRNLKSADIAFDNFVSEKSLSGDLARVMGILEQNGAIYTEDSKVWLKSTQKGDEKDRVIIRDTDKPTYLAGDIVYHYDKFKRDFDSYINIWGADHHGYIARIKASVEFLGFESKKLKVILSQMVSLLRGGVPYKMSKRAGNFILMSDIIDEIGIDALRFVFITKRADTHLEFDIDTLKAEDSNNPIYYINYANARIHTILAKAPAPNALNAENLEDLWKDLLIFALMLPKILESAFEESALQKLPEYLKILAGKLHFCYNSARVLGAHNEIDILATLKVVSISLTTGLKLMGIVAKTRM